MRRTRHRLAGGLVEIVGQHVDRAFVTAEHVLAAQRGFHRLIEPGLVQRVGQAFGGAGDEPRGDLDAEQRTDQHRGAFHRHVALAAQQDCRAVEVGPIRHHPRPSTRWRRGRGRTAGAAATRQQVVHLLQHSGQHIPHLRPPISQLNSAGQISVAVAALARRVDPPGAIRVLCRCQPACLAAGLTPRLALG